MAVLYSPSNIINAIHEYFKEQSYRKAAHKTGISKSTIHRWVTKFDDLLKRTPPKERKPRESIYKTLSNDIFKILESDQVILSIMGVPFILTMTV